MKSGYKTFKFTLRTMAPVHIGSGEKYTSQEFIYENDSFYFPDMGKFYASMGRELSIIAWSLLLMTTALKTETLVVTRLKKVVMKMINLV